MTSRKPIVWLEKASKLICCFKHQCLGSTQRKNKKTVKKTVKRRR